MLLKNIKTLILTSVVTLLPLVLGLLLWNRLPREMTIQWNFYGQAGDTASRGFVVFGMPLSMLAIQWFCILATALDTKNRGQNQKPLKRMLWVVPVLSNLIIGLIYAISLGGRNFSCGGDYRMPGTDVCGGRQYPAKMQTEQHPGASLLLDIEQ